VLDDVQRVKIVIEAIAEGAHAFVESAFAGVAEGWMADVMNESEGFGEIRIEIERRGDGASDLRYFKRVREAVAEMIGEARGENLRLRFETAEGARVDHAVAIARVIVAIGMLRFGMAAPTRAVNVHRIGRERHRRHGITGEEFRICLGEGSNPGRLAARSACPGSRS
jgi:hypothetical protein